MNRILLFICFFLCSCATLTNIIRANNIAYDNHSKIYKDHEVLEMFEEVLNTAGDQKNYIGWQFLFTDEWIKVKYVDNKIAFSDGITFGEQGLVIVKLHSGCIWDNSTYHEMMHIVHGDREHKNKKVWDKVKLVEKEFKSRCSDNYERDIPKF